MTSLWIPRSLMQDVLAHCRRELPNEACGLLAGQNYRVAAVLPMPNAAATPEENYLVEGAAQVRAFRLMAEKGWELIGIYHSHPSALPVPSRSDICQAYYPQALHMIVGMRSQAKPDVRVYRLMRDTLKAVRVGLETDHAHMLRATGNTRSQPGKATTSPAGCERWAWGRSQG